MCVCVCVAENLNAGDSGSLSRRFYIRVEIFKQDELYRCSLHFLKYGREVPF